MNVIRKIETSPEAVKRYIADGLPPDLAEKFAVQDVIDKELGPRGSESPLRQWLRLEMRVSGWDPVVTPELWHEWQAVKADYIAKLDAKAAASRAAYEAKLHTEHVARLADMGETAKRDDAERVRLDKLIAELQAYEFPPLELEPVDYAKLHAMKKSANKSKRELAKRWLEKFKAAPDNVQHAHTAFYVMSTMLAGVGTITTAESADDDSGDDDASEVTLIDDDALMFVYLTPNATGERNIHDGNADVVVAGLNHPEFDKLRRFTEGVARLIRDIGNPIDDVIDPAHDPNRPAPAQDVDDIDNSGTVADIVPGLIPRGLTVIHGDAKHTKSLFSQKLAITVADDTGATFEGIEVDHGQVIYVSRDPGAEPKVIKPGLIEIRDRLRLNPSGRLHLTGSPLILNEPASVAHWLELNAARLPAKLIVVDSLFSCSVGSLAQDIVVQGVCEGVRTLLQNADAVVAVHHDNKSGDIFGSVFLNAAMNGKIGVVRNVLKDGVLGDRVAVTVEFLKFADAGLKLAYRLEGPYLEAGESVGKGKVSAASIKRKDVLDSLATTPTPLRGLRDKINAELPDHVKPIDEKTWNRLRGAWEAAGLIEQKDGCIRRKA